MILDSGVCTISRKVNIAEAGRKPVYQDEPYHVSWYGELSFENAPERPTPGREEIRTDAKVRVLQNRSITQHDRAELDDQAGHKAVYEVRRAYHGVDDESGELITDLSLVEVSP